MPKNTLSIISDEKRDRIYDAAVHEFARKGYEKASIKNIAARAEISKGSLYDYFENKEDIYLAVCIHGINRSRQNIDDIIDDSLNFFDQIRNIFHRGLSFVMENPEYTQLYVNLSSCGMEHFAEKLTTKVEKTTADFYKSAIKRGIDGGYIRPDLDVNMAAFVINSLYIIMLISMVSRHYQIRMQEYLEIDEADVQEEAFRKIDQLIDTIRFSLEVHASD